MSAQVQKQIPTEAIASIDTTPTPPSANLAFVRDPIFWTILALAVLIRIILDRPSSDKK
ncbi:hypothetical protein TUMEXPCC7403_24585 [Tumidithrix helvetica PCC 7403]|uniref:hypothetical protein n=1 Tax=Tumidithrix helvetica TaxID=3457545 RepID=UPI003CA4ADD8